MKNLKIFSFGLALLMALTGCSSSFLDTEMTGSSMTQEEYESIDGTFAATVIGLYPSLYNYGGEHHSFGQKSFDIANDLTSGDIALTTFGYGWFSGDASLQAYSSRASELWSIAYATIKNANGVIYHYQKMEADSVKFSDEDLAAYAQALTMRGYYYFQMMYLFSTSIADESPNQRYGGAGGNDFRLIPYYDGSDAQINQETGFIAEQDLSTYGFIHEAIKADLTKAITLFDSAVEYVRPLKLYFDGDVARGILAYTLLHSRNPETQKADYEMAYDLAKEVINCGRYTMLTYDEVLTNGFNDINNENWMWGHDLTIDNSTGLASFFGHMDRFTYGYGGINPGILAIDENFYAELDSTDIRKKWFDSKDLGNLWKFYDPERVVMGDRDWLNDLVYMRIEEMYLIAAEAAWRSGNNSEAVSVLSELVAERNPKADINENNIKEQIYYNWRIELWGEGKSLMTLKRFDMPAKERGSNHYAYKNQPVDFTQFYLRYTVPYSEYSQNPSITYNEIIQ